MTKLINEPSFPYHLPNPAFSSISVVNVRTAETRIPSYLSLGGRPFNVQVEKNYVKGTVLNNDGCPQLGSLGRYQGVPCSPAT